MYSSRFFREIENEYKEIEKQQSVIIESERKKAKASFLHVPRSPPPLEERPQEGGARLLGVVALYLRDPQKVRH